MRRLILLLMVGCAGSSYVHIDVLPGDKTPTSGIFSLEMDVAFESGRDVAVFDRGGEELVFPTDAVLRVHDATGTIDVTAIARDAMNQELDRGSGSAAIFPGQTTSLKIQLGPALLALDRTSYDFGTILTGNRVSAVFLVKNVGASRSEPLSSTVTGGVDASLFSLTQNECEGRSLGSGEVCVVGVEVQASSAGVKTATLVVAAGELVAPATLPMQATVLDAGVLIASTTTHDFGLAIPQSVSGPFAVAITNNGDFQSGPLRVELTGSDASHFTATNTCAGVTLQPHQPCGLEVRFTPKSAGTFSSQLLISANPGGAAIVALSGSAGQVIVSVDSIAGGQGTVTSTPPGISCPGQCVAPFFPNTAVTLHAAPLANSALFAGWNRGLLAGPSACTGLATSCATTPSDVPTHAAFTGNNFVFVTRDAITVGSGMTGAWYDLGGDDLYCANRAAAAKLPGKYRAWLSFAATDAKSRLGSARGWILPNGTRVLDQLSTLDKTAGLLSPINVTEYGAPVSNPIDVLTNTKSDGTADGSSCAGPVLSYFRSGSVLQNDFRWTDDHTVDCGPMVSAHLYCFGYDLGNPLFP